VLRAERAILTQAAALFAQEGMMRCAALGSERWTRATAATLAPAAAASCACHAPATLPGRRGANQLTPGLMPI
jgi:hypothetical protein